MKTKNPDHIDNDEHRERDFEFKNDDYKYGSDAGWVFGSVD